MPTPRPPLSNQPQALPRRLALLGLILFLAFALRTWQLNYTDVEGDEAFSFTFSRDTLEGIVRTTIATGEPHPVGSYFFLHYWLLLAGDNDFAFRFPSAWFGVLAVAVIYRLGRRLHLRVASSREAVPVIAAMLLAFSPFLLAESRDGRMYSMSLGLTLASTWLAVELLASPLRRATPGRPGLSRLISSALPLRALGWLVAYILVSWFALNVHYFAGTILVAQNAFVLALLLATPWRAFIYTLVRWAIAQVAILLAFAPWYLLAQTILRDYHGMSYFSPPLGWMVQLMAGVFAVGEKAQQVSSVFAMIAGFALIIGAIRLWRAGPQPRWGAIFLVLYLVVPFTMAYLDSRNRATFAERQVIATAAGFYLLLAAGIAPAAAWLAHRNWRRMANAALPAVLGVATVAGVGLGLRGYYLDQKGRPNTWRPFMQLVQRYSANVPAAQLRVGQNYPEPGIAMYYRGTPGAITLPSHANDLDGSIQAVHDLASADVQRVIMRLDALNWWNGGTERDIAQIALASSFTKVYDAFTGRWTMVIYSRMNANDLKPIGISFADGVRLQAAAIRGLTAMRASVPGKYLEVHLHWDGADARLKGTEKVYIHVTDANGQVPSQLDVPLTAQDVQQPVKTYSVPLADSLHAGQYAIRVGLYDPDLPGAPRLRTSDNSDGIVIGTLSIDD